MLLGAVPNLSAGRDPWPGRRAAIAARGAGVHVLDVHPDADHNRTVLTLCGPDGALEDGLLAMVAEAVRRIDIGRHRGVHPRVGAADVVPVVPLTPDGMPAAAEVARRLGRRIHAELGVPVFFYGTVLGGPSLADIRGGRAAPALGREPHPGAGFACVGARGPLVAYNVLFPGARMETVRRLAAGLRATAAGGLEGVQALALELRPSVPQLSMNLVDPVRSPPAAVLEEVRRRAAAMGLEPGPDEIVGLCPAAAAVDLPSAGGRVLEARLAAAGLCAGAHAVRRLGDSDELRRVQRRLLAEGRRLAAVGSAGHDLLATAEAAAMLPGYIAASGADVTTAAPLLALAARRLRAALPAGVLEGNPERVQLLDRVLK